MVNHNQSDQYWTSKIIIRQVVQNDLPVLEWEGQFRHFRRIFLEAYERACCGKSVLWVAEYPDHGLIGQAFVQLDSDRKELADGIARAYAYGFRVRAAYQSHGIGSKLLTEMEKDLNSRGFHILTLNVAKDNILARKFYGRHGFYIVAHEPGEWSYPDENGEWRTVVEPAWRMEKKIQPSLFKPDNKHLQSFPE